MQELLMVEAYCTRLLRDKGSNFVSAAARLGVTDMFCVAHSLHLVVAGVLIKKKKEEEEKKKKKKANKPAGKSAGTSADTSADESVETPAWAGQVASESAEPIPKHHEDEQLSIEEREDMEALRDLACDEMDEYLDSALLSLERDELDAVRGVVQQFLMLSSYFRKSPKGQNRLGRKEFEGMDSKLRRPNASEWLTIKCLSTLLAPFAAATTALSVQQYPTLHLHFSRKDLFAAHVAVAGEKPYVAEPEVMMNECRTMILKLFNERFSELEQCELVWVAYLDPCVGKRMSHLSATDSQGSFMDDLFGPDEVPRQRSDIDKECADEFTLYLSDIKTVRSTDDPLLWWRINASKYPHFKSAC
ncbi:hypothetical protein PHYSODRAFT_293397 [Phytophthora sojae]|uniref:HAT C-terminal dimerisation domain-containing protein n=1 Tax=Phytophthora sojae (strain P6497) TaxID=1094619 RepID=G4YF01_PHYSP|nr:hypothetical protein PHYSODRAFT_293397 [Phytophthora sojae]EGZ27584.1 hypothetical protein PHYSODRAFT_293397 [Phytophthora sojae]|eukprot:XP_009514859.1 hypothetical protein PHYSODRAFT_293397 [Phytophthora sojae]